MNDLTRYIIFFGVFVVSGSVHEAAHAWSAWRLGDSTARDRGRISLNPLVHVDIIGTVIFPAILIYSGWPFCFGWMKPVPVYTPALRQPVRDSLLVSLAGPFSNLLLAALSALAFVLLDGLDLLTPNISLFVTVMILINLILALFNLLPIPPLDGSSIVDFIRRDPNESYHRQGGLGMMVLFLLFYLGLLRHLRSAVFAAMDFLLSSPFVPILSLALFVAALVVFTIRNRPEGAPVKPKKKGRVEVEISRTMKRAWQIADAISRGEDLTAADRRWFEKLKEDRGDGEPLCSPMSFDVRNDFCRDCRNLNRCILRQAERSTPS